ncbi:hypothetical protein [Parapedobacter sp. DT-150]|uniref:hypothetical protein n=1 Tax=Parapedobacter sp. DT-150 TaxID=3396162 RepID=UPI003F1D498A
MADVTATVHPAGLPYQMPGTTAYTYDGNGNLLTRKNTNTGSSQSCNNITAAVYKDKLSQYIKDPDKFDNKGILQGKSPELREKIISGRVKELQSQITKQENELNKVRNQLNEVKKVKDDQRML